jgi:hypothetical protein
MHIFLTIALILAYGVLLIFGLLHVLQSLIARPTPWLRMALEAGEDESPTPSTPHSHEPSGRADASAGDNPPDNFGGNAHARAE